MHALTHTHTHARTLAHTPDSPCLAGGVAGHGGAADDDVEARGRLVQGGSTAARGPRPPHPDRCALRSTVDSGG